MAVAQWIRRVPTDANQNDVDWKAHSLGSQHRGSSLFSQSAQHRPAGGLTANATEPPPVPAPVTDRDQAGENPDPLYKSAVAVVAKEGKASISMLQSHLQIGYTRAARLLERMHAEGKISAVDDLDDVGFRKLISA